MYDNRPIGIFDSGVGGLSIYREVKKLLPRESFIYLADQKNNPYGGRSVKEIQNLSSNVVSFLVKQNTKAIIVACNTVSVNAIDYLRSKFNLPIIAVVPVIKTIARESKTRKVAVFSTLATAKSKYLKDLIRKFAKGCRVYKIGNSKLEYLVEDGVISGPKVASAIKSSLLPGLSENVDVIALGCTHYPFLTPEIKKVVGSKIKIYDSGGAIARRMKFVLGHENMAAGKKGKDYYYTTGDVSHFKKVAEKLLKTRLEPIEKAVI